MSAALESDSDARTLACRICLDTKNTNSVSFDEESDLLDMYEFCFGITISPEDMPRKLCDVCVKKMKNFAKLKNQSIESDKLWRRTIVVDTKCHVIENISETEEKLVTIKQEDYDDYVDNATDNITFELNQDYDTMKDEKKSFEDELKDSALEKTKHEKKSQNKSKISYKKCKETNTYVCKWCNRKYKLKVNYKRHIMKNTCRFEQKLKSQTIQKVAANKEFYCGLCDEKSSQSADIKEHLKVHSSRNDLSCKLCDFTGRDFADMEAHRYSHQPDPDLSIECHRCDNLKNKNRNLLGLQFHYRSVHLEKPGGWCAQCSKVYTSYKCFRDHDRWHKDAKFICDICGKRFIFRNAIEAHMFNHMDYRHYVCDVCGNKFRRPSTLRLHMEQVHDDKRVTCTHCNKTFKNEKNLKIHLLIAAREKKLQCEFCSKCYASPSLLRQHMIWHKNDRPFVCNLCGSAYKVRTQLKIHMRRHTGDFPFKCTIPECPRAFACSNQLKVHLNVHSGIRKYKCPYCEKTFHEKKNVVTHCARHHNFSDALVTTSSKKQVSKSDG